MGKIERVPFPMAGTNDTVEMVTDCGVSKLKILFDGKFEVKGSPVKSQCKLIASGERGLLGVMVASKDIVVGVKLDDAREIIKAADEAYSKENDQQGGHE